MDEPHTNDEPASEDDIWQPARAPQIHKRIGGMLRDAWYLAIVLVIASIAMWIFLAPIMGVVAIVLGFATFAYFGVLRYDDDGNEIEDERM